MQVRLRCNVALLFRKETFPLSLIFMAFLLIVIMLAKSMFVAQYVPNMSQNISQMTVQDALYKLQISINTAHFSRDKHQGDDPNPDKIKQLIMTGACNPVTIYTCVGTTDASRMKFVCPYSPTVEIGIVIALDSSESMPLAVTAFPAPIGYWTSEGVAGCSIIGQFIHP